MNSAKSILVCLAALACFAALILSVYPGILNELAFVTVVLSIFLVPVFATAMIVALIVLARKGTLKNTRVPWRHVVTVVAMLACTLVLLKFYVPRRIAFAMSRSAFEELLPQAAMSRHRKPVNQRVGAYWVDEYSADARGGVYFRVYTGSDGIGPDQMSYGFAYQPNAMGTPFGAAGYWTFRLGSNWCWFRASDDWY